MDKSTKCPHFKSKCPSLFVVFSSVIEKGSFYCSLGKNSRMLIAKRHVFKNRTDRPEL